MSANSAGPASVAFELQCRQHERKKQNTSRPCLRYTVQSFKFSTVIQIVTNGSVIVFYTKYK